MQGMGESDNCIGLAVENRRGGKLVDVRPITS